MSTGEILAMAGGTPEHAALAMAIGRQLGNQLEGRTCRVFSSDLRVRVLATGLTTYPDVTVICGPSERDPENSATRGQSYGGRRSDERQQRSL